MQSLYENHISDVNDLDTCAVSDAGGSPRFGLSREQAVDCLNQTLLSASAYWNMAFQPVESRDLFYTHIRTLSTHLTSILLCITDTPMLLVSSMTSYKGRFLLL